MRYLKAAEPTNTTGVLAVGIGRQWVCGDVKETGHGRADHRRAGAALSIAKTCLGVLAIGLLAVCGSTSSASGQERGGGDVGGSGFSLGSPVIEMMKKHPSGNYTQYGENYIVGAIHKGGAAITVCFKDRRAIAITMRLPGPKAYAEALAALRGKFGKPQSMTTYSATWDLAKDRSIQLEGQNFEGELLNGYLIMSEYLRSEQAEMDAALADKESAKKLFEK
jgi:hypothetical protein